MRLVLILLVACLGLSFISNGDITLLGEYKKAPAGEKIWLRKVIDARAKKFDVIDSAIVENNRFHFNLKNIQPQKYQLVNGKGRTVSVYLDLGRSSIVIDSTFKKIATGGNEIDSLTARFDDVRFSYALMTMAYGSLRGKYGKEGKEVPDSITKAMPKILDSLSTRSSATTKSIAKRADMASAYVLTRAADEFSAAELMEIYGRMPAYVRKSPDGLLFKSSLDKLNAIAEGSKAPDFTEKSPEGTEVTLSKFVKGKKLVLIDFWASWCGPCRAENPNVVKIYQDYKSKGFDIIGVSLDDKKENWIKAIADDHLTWTHVSDLGGWNARVGKMYLIKAVPQTLLLDGNGKIIAKNLRGDALKKKVAEICN